MGLRLTRGDIAFIVFVVVALAALVFGLFGPRPAGPTLPVKTVTPAGNVSASNVIVRENALLGTTHWKIPGGQASSTQIQAYANATSVLPGQTLTFYVSTLKDATPYTIDIYRLGWYGGAGGRLMISLPNQLARAQGYYDYVNGTLAGCISCHVDVKTGLVEANWQPSYILTIPSDWVTGIYLAKFTDENGMQTYVPFDVKGSTHSLYVAVTPDTTYAAYNGWGGYSLYAARGSASSESVALVRGVKVSFDRPYADDEGASQVLALEADAIHWLERQGYDLSYISDVDLHENPVQLLQHKAYLSLGHDEYWTKQMRDGVEHARDNGVGLAFLGANASYWQMRFEPDSAGLPNRTIVCYKVLTGNNNLADDPLYGKDNTRVTTQWRDPLLARPENALIGIMYSSLVRGLNGFPWQVSSTASSPLLAGTDLQVGGQYGCDLVGNEWDRIFANGATPAGLQVLSISQTVDIYHNHGTSNTTYYIAPSGAMVFATGSIYWTKALDTYRSSQDQLCIGKDTAVPAMQKLMANVMDTLIMHHS